VFPLSLQTAPGALALPACLAPLVLLALPAAGRAQPASRGPRNVVIILSDDHRHDFMSVHAGAPAFLKTPGLDRMAAQGAHFRNAFVTTALCSPSRASILTGKYAHKHGVIDNASEVPAGTVFFPERLQKAGYATAYVGKWHMGHESDAPRPGFARWVSFRGQGTYFDPVLNVDGRRVEAEGYTTDVLTDYAIEWLKQRDQRPFFLVLSHKAVHHEFLPAPRHQGRYAGAPVRYPVTYWNTEDNHRGRPRWVKEQRYSWHGVDYPYYLEGGPFEEVYRRYAETLLALDESVGRVLDHLDQSGLAKDTLVLYLGDNGFSFGEHGLIDKRHAYEESMRIPLLAYAPGHIRPGTVVSEMVLNVDIAPTVLGLAGLSVPEDVDGRSVWPLLTGAKTPWRDEFVYAYYWEYNFPQTPTTFALRGERYKYVFYHGLWDVDELFDLERDPQERFNLALVPDHREQVERMRGRLFDLLEAAGALDVRFRRPVGGQIDRRLVPGRD